MTASRIGGVFVRQLTERIGTDALRFLCYCDLWRSCRQMPWLSLWESQVLHSTHYAERCIEVRTCVCSTNWDLWG